MTSTLLERTRALHEEIERCERLVAKDFHKAAKSHASRLSQNHRVLQCVEGIRKRSRDLLDIYADEDGSRRDEVDAMSSDSNQVYSLFYQRLKEARDYHRRNPGLDVPTTEEEEAKFLRSRPKVDFSGEEMRGRFLDLHSIHRAFTNAPKIGRNDLSYLDFLNAFHDFASIPKAAKLTEEYLKYLEELEAYLSGFYRKAQPLACLSDPLAAVEEDFHAKWARGEIPGWQEDGPSTSQNEEAAGAEINLDDCETSADLEGVGADRLKAALVALGLKAGGTLAQKADRLMSTKGKERGDWDPKIFAKGRKPPKTEAEAKERADQHKRSALLEAKIGALVTLLQDTLADTKKQVEKKATSTYEELVADMAEMDEGEDEDEDDGRRDGGEGGGEDDDEENENIIYNPLKLPVGFDGKPIPYWLFKLHGLNQEFKCEICGNHSYWGRRAFEKHFKEPRHQHGMKCLGIPYTKVFAEVTKIDEALALWEAMKEKTKTKFTDDLEEEFEDKEGNVYNKKEYMDLQRQGLL